MTVVVGSCCCYYYCCCCCYSLLLLGPFMKWKNMSSPTPSVDSSSGAPATCPFVDQGELSLDFNSSSSSSTCSISSAIFPHISISNGILSNGYSNNGSSGHFNGDFNGLPSPTGTASLKCGICHENFTRPKVLPCLHTFCQDCLEKAQDIGDRLVCPSCRQECPLGSQVRSLLLCPVSLKIYIPLYSLIFLLLLLGSVNNTFFSSRK